MLDRIESALRRVLNSLLGTARVNRLVEQEVVDGAAAYVATDFLAEVRKGVWSEVYGDAVPVVDGYRRNLQRAYIETLGDRINGRSAVAADARAFFRGELKTLDADLKGTLAKATDRATRLHIEVIQTQIAHALDPSIRGEAGATGTGRVAPRSTSSTSPSRPTRAGSITRLGRVDRASRPRISGLKAGAT